jgi:hypothetical protein
LIPFRLTYKEFAGAAFRSGSLAPPAKLADPPRRSHVVANRGLTPGTADCRGFDPARGLNLEHSGAQSA